MTSYNRQKLLAFVGGDEALADEMAALFVKNGKDYLEDLRRCLGQSEGQPWYEAAHKLKGAALAIGAVTLAAACREAEAHKDNIAGRGNEFAAVDAAFQDVCREISASAG